MGGPETGGWKETAGNLWNAGVDLATDALEGGVKKGQEALEEGQELLPLIDDFYTLYDANKYFEDNMEELESFGLTDVLTNPDVVSQKITEANVWILRMNGSLAAIKNENIRFSKSFMGPTIERLEELVDRFDSVAYKIIKMLSKKLALANEPFKLRLMNDPIEMGIRIEKALGSKRPEKVYDLAITLQYTHSLVRATKTDLEGLVDPTLPEDEPCNNMFISTGIKGYEAYEDISHSFERWKTAAEAVEAYRDGEYVKAAKKAAEYALDDNED